MGSTKTVPDGISWEADVKFLTLEEIKRLKQTCSSRAWWGGKLGRKIPVRDWLIIHIALSTGLRVQEIAHLNCGDILLADGLNAVIVRQGKGGKRRLVRFNGELKEHLTEYLEWKQVNKEGIKTEDPLIKSSITGGPACCLPVPNARQTGTQTGGAGRHLNKRSVQRTFERTSRLAKIDGRHCFHHLRHTYASHLYRASNYNLRLVQKQLGHASIRTTQIYADIFDEDLKKALDKLYK
jgi:integrase